MDYTKIKRWQKTEALEQCVLSETPAEAARALKEMGEVRFTARALGFACRYRGLEMVKALVEGGASFSYDLCMVRLSYRDKDRYNIPVDSENENYSLALASSVHTVYMHEVFHIGKTYRQELLPLTARLTILDYLCENAEKTGFRPDEFMFYAYFSEEWEMIDMLRSRGVEFPKEKIALMTEGGDRDAWYDYCYLVFRLENEEFFEVMPKLIKECGEKKLHMTEYFWDTNEKRFLQPEFLKFLFDSFDLSKMNKGWILKKIIDRGDVSSLRIAADNGWLKQPKKRDEMIQYAAERGNAEISAFLLDFKNRTADLKAERERAEKKAERELNAAPDSVMMLRKIWNFKKGEDGGIIITGYKGEQTIITVPEKIGKSRVTVINRMAFSPRAGRLNVKDSTFRKTITEVILPEGITKIGDEAFHDCAMLKSVNIPRSVKEIGSRAFARCGSLEKIIMPEGLREIGEFAFLDCNSLKEITVPEGVEKIGQQAMAHCSMLKTVTLPKSLKEIDDVYYNLLVGSSPSVIVVKGSYAESYCKDNGILFTYKEEV